MYGWLIATIGRNTCPLVVSNDSQHSPGPPSSGDACTNVFAHCHGHQNGQQTGCIFSLSLFCMWPWQLLGWYRASSCPMAASSSFRYSPGHPPLGDTLRNAPLHCHGYQNGQWRRYICSFLLPFLFDKNVAKRPCYGLFKLTPSHNNNLKGVISLFVCYWPLSMIMDAVLATTVANGWAQFE